jgi:hypothetical protein
VSFPKKLDHEDMNLAIKEWRLAGYDVVEHPHRHPVFPASVSVGELKNVKSIHPVWVWCEDYKLRGDVWELVSPRERKFA